MADHSHRNTTHGAGGGTTEAELVESSDYEIDGAGTGGNVGKKAVWNKPSSGAPAETEVMNPVMDAVCWPALSEVSTKDVGMTSSSHRQPSSNNAYPNSTPNCVGSTRQRSMKRGSGDDSRKDGGQREGFGTQSHVGNEQHQHQRNSNRRGGNVGLHPRGHGMNHHGGRRDQERDNQDWNPHRGWGNRDNHRGSARPFMRAPPHTLPPFIPPPIPVQPYQTSMVYPEIPPVFYFSGPHPMLAPMPPIFFPFPDPQLHTKIVNQIDYYFSNENLIKDTFLRRNMDEHGWVPVTLIAGFKKVMQLTENIHLILDAVRSSTVVEVQGEKLRRRNDWNRWIMPPSFQNSTTSNPQILKKSSPDLLAVNLQNITFDDETTRHVNTDACFELMS